MPSKISHIKETKILYHYFSGMPQIKISQKCGITQPTVSRYVSKFQKVAAIKGILWAAKEYGIMEEITMLRSLASDLYKSKVSIEEAKDGLKMAVLFNSLDVPTEEFKALTKAIKKLKDPGFAKFGVKLIKLEEATGKEYPEIVGEFEQLGDEIASRQEKVAVLKTEQADEEKALEALKLNRKDKEDNLKEFLEEAEKKKAAADTEVKEKLAEAGLMLDKIAKLHPIVEKMNALGISDDDIETFVGERQVLVEKGVTWEKFKTVAVALAEAGEIDGNGLTEKLAEFGTLQQAITSMKTDLGSLQPQVEKYKNEKEQLKNQVDGLGKKKVQLEEEVEQNKALKESLDKVINALPSAEKLYNRLERDVSVLETKKAGLDEEACQKEKQIADMNEKLKKAGELDKELKEKKEQLQELNSMIAAAGEKIELFEAFLGLVNAKSITEVEEFQKSATKLINEAKLGNYDTAFLADQVIGNLTSGAFNLIACQECETEFIIVKRGKKQIQGGVSTIDQRCPRCGGIHTVVKKNLLVPTLKKVIVTGKPIMVKKQGGDAKQLEEGEVTS